jgi:arylsulfatase
MPARNAVLILIDSLRSDHLGCYGYFRDTTPNLDRLAAEGAVFLDHRASAVAVAPGLTSILTGLTPMRHGFYVTPMLENAPVALRPNIKTLPELLQSAGLVTAAVDTVISFPFACAHYARGFDYYMDPYRPGDAGPWAVPGERVRDRAIEFLDAHSAKPFFLLVHLWEPHPPYAAPAEYLEKFHHAPGDRADLPARRAENGYDYVPGWGPVDDMVDGTAAGGCSIDRYDGTVAYADKLAGDVLRKIDDLGRRDDTLVVVTSPCGAGLGGHGHWGCTGLYEQSVRVPLILRGPSIEAGARIRGDSCHNDVAPTVLTGLNGPCMNAPDGTSLYPRVIGESGAPPFTIMESGRYRAVHSRQWKLIHATDTDAVELFSLSADPMERCDLSERFPEKRDALLALLDEWVERGLEAAGREDPILAFRQHWGRGVSDLGLAPPSPG